MKKALILSLLMLGFSAHAGNVSVSEVDLGVASSNSTPAANEAAAEIGFLLEIEDQFLVKIFNDALASSGTRLSPNPEDVIDLGSISAGIAAATQCSDLVGLTQASALGQSSTATDAETTVVLAGALAQCDVQSISAGNKRVRFLIPLEVAAIKSGGSALDLSYTISQVAGKEFDVLKVCQGAAAPSATGCDAGAADHAGGQLIDNASSVGQETVQVEVHASLLAGSKSEYEGYVIATASIQP